MANGRCRVHGGKTPARGARNESHPNFKTGKYTIETRELVQQLRELAKVGETLAAAAYRSVRRPVPERLRRRKHVRAALKEMAEARKAKAKEGAK